MENNLLIIEDNKEVVEIISLVLDGMFDKISNASTVDHAQEILNKNTYSLIFLDINLENRNGAEVVKFLNESHENPNKNVPVIILSGIMTQQFIDRYQKRFAAVILKPFEHNEMKKIVSEILAARKRDTNNILENTPIDEIPFLKCDLPFPIDKLEENVNNVLAQVKKTPKLKQLFAQIKADRNGDNYIMAHIGLIINISTAICIQMDWSTDKTLEKFVYASYLHDMALVQRPDLAKINTLGALELLKDTLTEAEYKLVFEHSNIAANNIENMDEIPADVAIIIRQHHELPKETGFPAKCNHQKITPFSAVFIFSHDFAEYILAHPRWTIDDYLTRAKAKFHGQHFSKIIKSFSK